VGVRVGGVVDKGGGMWCFHGLVALREAGIGMVE
jgi:hypothetical protein